MEYVHLLTLKESLSGIKHIELIHLSGETLKVDVSRCIGSSNFLTPDSVQTIANKGFPNSKTGKFGNLIIKFKLVFPQSLTEQQKKQINDAFSEDQDQNMSSPQSVHQRQKEEQNEEGEEEE